MRLSMIDFADPPTVTSNELRSVSCSEVGRWSRDTPATRTPTSSMLVRTALPRSEVVGCFSVSALGLRTMLVSVWHSAAAFKAPGLTFAAGTRSPTDCQPLTGGRTRTLVGNIHNSTSHEGTGCANAQTPEVTDAPEGRMCLTVARSCSRVAGLGSTMPDWQVSAM